MNKTDCVEFLKSRLQKDKLPGMKAMAIMAPSDRQLSYPQEGEYTDSAVSIVLYEKDNELYFPLIKRTSHNKNDKHKGQISLPGGKYDKEDKTLLNCAMRELEEELGITNANVTTIGELTKLFIPVSNFMVHPFVLFTPNPVRFIPQESEVEYVLEVKLNELLDDKNSKIGEIELFAGKKLQGIPYFKLDNHVIWGATAMILNEFKNVALAYKTK